MALSKKTCSLAAAVMITTSAWSAPAEAATSGTYSRPYSMVKEFYSKPLKRCLRATLWGTIRFTYSSNSHGGSYKNVILVNPTMRHSVLKKCGTTETATVTKSTLTQRWYDQRCKATVRVTGGFPWFINVSVTPECGNYKAASRKTTYSTKAKYYTQYNSGDPVHWKTYWSWGPVEPKPAPKICLAARPTITAYIGSKSDSWSTSMKACVKK